MRPTAVTRPPAVARSVAVVCCPVCWLEAPLRRSSCDAGCCEPACGAADPCCEPACGAPTPAVLPIPLVTRPPAVARSIAVVCCRVCWRRHRCGRAAATRAAVNRLVALPTPAVNRPAARRIRAATAAVTRAAAAWSQAVQRWSAGSSDEPQQGVCCDSGCDVAAANPPVVHRYAVIRPVARRTVVRLPAVAPAAPVIQPTPAEEDSAAAPVDPSAKNGQETACSCRQPRDSLWSLKPVELIHPNSVGATERPPQAGGLSVLDRSANRRSPAVQLAASIRRPSRHAAQPRPCLLAVSPRCRAQPSRWTCSWSRSEGRRFPSGNSLRFQLLLIELVKRSGGRHGHTLVDH